MHWEASLDPKMQLEVGLIFGHQRMKHRPVPTNLIRHPQTGQKGPDIITYPSTT